MAIAGGEDECDIGNAGARAVQPNLLLKSRQWLPGALAVHPREVFRVHMEELTGNRRNLPPVAGVVHTVNLLLALFRWKQIMQRLSVFKHKCV